MECKAIETVYNGYKFRSRLEARWAVFFDKAEIPYQYEPEGFNLGPYGYYLPDFFLPWFNAYVEIKPKNSDQIHDAETKLKALFDGTEFLTILCVGDPVDNDMRIYCNDCTESSGGGPNEWPAKFIEGGEFRIEPDVVGGYSKHTISIVVGGPHDRERSFFNSYWNRLRYVDQLCDLVSYRSDLEYAKLAARQARFEHGEKSPITTSKIYFSEEIPF